MAFEKTNAPCRPQFEGQIVKFTSEHGVTLYDIAKRNPKYGNLEWWALNEPTADQIFLSTQGE
jgi:hypothetical protein